MEYVKSILSPILLTALQAIFILLTCGRIYREKLQMQLFSRQIEKSIISLSIDHYVCNHSKMHFCAIKKRLYNIFLIGFFAILFLDQLLWPFKSWFTSTVDTFIFVHKKWKKQIRTSKDICKYYNQRKHLFCFKFHLVLDITFLLIFFAASNAAMLFHI